MKTSLLIIIAMGILPAISTSFASCIVNEDWSEAPCLDSIANGWYNQDEVDQWTNYYSYKGSIFMEAKYLELSEAIKEDRVKGWAEESIENRNVYEYYFFSGRAPNTGEYDGQFDVIKISKDELGKPIPDYPAPLQQIREGVEPTHVTCTEGLELVLKKSSGLPACVKPTSVSKLIERGWAIHFLPEYDAENNNSEIFVKGTFDVETEFVNYFDGTEGYLAKPTVEEQFPGIVMIHEWWGLNDNIKEMAEKLASHGYVVLAVDLYGGNVATTSDEAMQLIGSFDSQIGIENMNSAASYLREDHNAEKLGSIGWCFGGGQSLNLALNIEDMDTTIIYYGQLVTEKDSLSAIDWPVLGIFAELDQGITVDNVRNFETVLNELEIPNEIHIYSGVDHAFANPSGDRYAEEESKDAWQKTLKFLNENLS